MHKWVINIAIVGLLCCYNVLAQNGAVGGGTSTSTATDNIYFVLDSNDGPHYVFSEEKDMKPCTCDTVEGECDYRCCCDSDCKDKVTQWKQEKLCVDKQYSHTSELKCKENTVEYNTREVGMNFFDQIKQLLCVKYDNSKDTGEFYQDTIETDIVDEELYKEWKNKVWKDSASGGRLRQLQEEKNIITFYSTEDGLLNKATNFCGFVLDPQTNFKFNVNIDIEKGNINQQAAQEPFSISKYGINSTLNSTVVIPEECEPWKNYYLYILTAKFGLKTNPQSYILDAKLVEAEGSESPMLKIRFKDVTEYDD